jgi:exportin-1
MESAKQNTEVLNNASQIKVLSNVLKTNVSACLSVGPGFISQLGQIYMDLLTLYRAVGVIVSQNVAQQGKVNKLYYKEIHTKMISLLGPVAVKTPKVRGLRTIKRDVLKLIDTYIECATDLLTINDNMVNPFLDTVLTDYNSSVDIAKDPEVLDAIATMVNKLGVSL